MSFKIEDAIWQDLKEKQILIAGNNTPWKDNFMESLSYIATSSGGSFAVNEYTSESLYLQGPADYIIVFPKIETAMQLQAFLDQLQQFAKMQPQAVLVMSEDTVYGKLYGPQHPVKETELGYAGHITGEQRPVFYQRMAEHAACQMATDPVLIADQRLHTKIARGCSSLTQDALMKQLEAALWVLLKARPGEAWNLPGMAETTEEGASETSPLRPMQITLDISKITKEMNQTCF